MSGPEICQIKNDIVAWVILGYLCSHPHAKDTAEGVRNWWLASERISVDADDVRGSLDYLVRLGWMSMSNGKAGDAVYGLKMNRRQVLQRFLSMQVSYH